MNNKEQDHKKSRASGANTLAYLNNYWFTKITVKEMLLNIANL